MSKYVSSWKMEMADEFLVSASFESLSESILECSIIHCLAEDNRNICCLDFLPFIGLDIFVVEGIVFIV